MDIAADAAIGFAIGMFVGATVAVIGYAVIVASSFERKVAEEVELRLRGGRDEGR
jgi:hypothetical protein